jgi:hypothetical protein
MQRREGDFWTQDGRGEGKTTNLKIHWNISKKGWTR